MTRSARPSTFSPGSGSGMHDAVVARAQISLYAATSINTGPLSVDADGFAKSTWKRNKVRCVASASPTRWFGAPAGGRIDPSRSAGSRLDTDGGCWKQMAFAGAPVNIAARSKAHACAPAKPFPGKTLIVL